MQLCDAHGLPIISLIDSPGFMVGPDIEAKAQVRHVSRMFVAAAKLRMPILAVTLRKCYGLGAMAMAGGGWHASHFTVAWPTGEYGPMGLEGAIQLGFKKELQAVPDGPERKALYDQLVAQMYARGHAMNVAAMWRSTRSSTRPRRASGWCPASTPPPCTQPSPAAALWTPGKASPGRAAVHPGMKGAATFPKETRT
jgi:hypothetical protein